MQTSADQYRLVVTRLRDLLRDTPRDAGLDAVLSAFPAAGDVYENLQYQWAGLCRSPLDRAVQSELLARKALGRIAGRAAA